MLSVRCGGLAILLDDGVLRVRVLMTKVCHTMVCVCPRRCLPRAAGVDGAGGLLEVRPCNTPRANVVYILDTTPHTAFLSNRSLAGRTKVVSRKRRVRRIDVRSTRLGVFSSFFSPYGRWYFRLVSLQAPED